MTFVDRFRGTSSFNTKNGLIQITNMQLLGIPGFNYSIKIII